MLSIDEERIKQITFSVLVNKFTSKKDKKCGLSDEDRQMFDRIFNSIDKEPEAYYVYHRYGKVRE